MSEADFMAQVVERSREVPVVVDFWAAWCGPCRQLGPALEAAVSKREGRVDLAKVDVDANQGVAASFDVRGIPAVKAFKDGQVAAQFTGAIPPAQIERFLDEIVSSPADDLVARGDEQSLREALAIDAGHEGAAIGLGRILLGRGETDAALDLLEPLAGNFVAEGLVARARLEQANGDGAEPAAGLSAAFAAWDDGDYELALNGLQEAIAAEGDPDRRDLIRRAMVGMFTELGADHALAREHRRRLAAALN